MTNKLPVIGKSYKDKTTGKIVEAKLMKNWFIGKEPAYSVNCIEKGSYLSAKSYFENLHIKIN